MLFSISGKFNRERGCSPVLSSGSVEWLVTFSLLNPVFGRKNLLLKCFAEATMVIKIALIIWIIFWTETSLLLNSPEPFSWASLGVTRVFLGCVRGCGYGGHTGWAVLQRGCAD